MRKSVQEDIKWGFIAAFFLWLVILWAVGWEYFLPSCVVVLLCSVVTFFFYIWIPEKYAFPVVGLLWVASFLFAYLLPYPWNHCMGVTLSGVLIGSKLFIVYRERKKQGMLNPPPREVKGQR